MINKVDKSLSEVIETSVHKHDYEYRNTIAESVFNKMNLDDDEVVTESEAALFGFTTLGKAPITINDFKSKVDEFFSRTIFQDDIIKSYESAFWHILESGQEARLSEDKRKELLFTIEMFEAIQRILGDDIDYVKGNQDDIKNRLKNGGKISAVELANVLNQNTISRKKSDGLIASFKQGNLGDCWFLSMLNTYSSSKIGTENIKNRIIDNKNGNYTVLFNNPFEQDKIEKYEVTKDDLSAKDNPSNPNEFLKAALGDIDVKILEIAAEKLLDRYLDNADREYSYSYDDVTKLIEGGDPIKEVLIHRAFGYKDYPIWFTKVGPGEIESKSSVLYKNDSGKAALVATDNPGDIRLFCKNKTKFYSFAGLVRTGGFKPEEINVATHYDEDAVNLTDLDKEFLSSTHQFNFNKLDEYGIKVTNPHMSPFPIGIGFEKFEKLFELLSVYPQNNLITVEECR